MFLLPGGVVFVGLALGLLPTASALTLAFWIGAGLLVLDVRMGREGSPVENQAA